MTPTDLRECVGRVCEFWNEVYTKCRDDGGSWHASAATANRACEIMMEALRTAREIERSSDGKQG